MSTILANVYSMMLMIYYPKNTQLTMPLTCSLPPSDSEDDLDPDPSSGLDDSSSISVESVTQPVSSTPISIHLLTLGLQFEKSGSSREDYVRMREYLNFTQSLNPGGEVIDYPLKLDTLQRLPRSSLPLLRLLRKSVPVTVSKQPSLPMKQKRNMQAATIIHRASWLYWFDPIDLARSILSATKLFENAHFGMAEWVDEPVEFWHSRSWASSSIATPGQHVYATDGSMLIPGDIVRIIETEGYTKCRIVSVGRDLRTSCPEPGEVSLLVQGITNRGGIPDVILQKLGYTSPRELWIMRDTEFHIPPTQVLCVLSSAILVRANSGSCVIQSSTFHQPKYSVYWKSY